MYRLIRKHSLKRKYKIKVHVPFYKSAMDLELLLTSYMGVTGILDFTCKVLSYDWMSATCAAVDKDLQCQKCNVSAHEHQSEPRGACLWMWLHSCFLTIMITAIKVTPKNLGKKLRKEGDVKKAIKIKKKKLWKNTRVAFVWRSH